MYPSLPTNHLAVHRLGAKSSPDMGRGGYWFRGERPGKQKPKDRAAGMGTGSLAVSKAIISHDGTLQRGVMSSAGRLANEVDGVSRGCVGRTDRTESTMRGRMGEGVRRMDRESMTDS